MKVRSLELPEVLLIEPKIFEDRRGCFLETWSKERYEEAGLGERFVQDNASLSMQGTLRGLHLQHPHGQGKLVFVLEGEVFDVAVDVRRGSPRFGRWLGWQLSCTNMHQLYIPPGFAHGFCVTSSKAVFVYKCTESYRPEAELGIRYDDTDIGISWPVDQPIVSEKDAKNARLAELDPTLLPPFVPEL
ncbi:MAG: dTDP-4-dehydrorhamnose 3,5-epimerase [Proteobacteria bacterium]|nr:dTDP-4-dehydrorhamnose 3,5-epimerase [Pseudomonadota bacterium]